MSVKLVMGAQRDSLEKLEKFGGEDGGVIFPHFRQVLENALRFELGEVGVMILRNQFPMDTIKSEKCEMPECTDERKIGEKIMKGTDINSS